MATRDNMHSVRGRQHPPNAHQVSSSPASKQAAGHPDESDLIVTTSDQSVLCSDDDTEEDYTGQVVAYGGSESSLHDTTADINGSTISPSTNGSFTVPVKDAIAGHLTSDTIPSAILDILRAQIAIWTAKAPTTWGQVSRSRFSIRCINCRVLRKATKRKHGRPMACEYCVNMQQICVLLWNFRGETVLRLLPVKQNGDSVVSARERGYWINGDPDTSIKNATPADSGSDDR